MTEIMTPAKPMKKSGGILGRYALILEALAMAPEGLSLKEVGRVTKLRPATVYRLVNALRHVEYVGVEGGRRSYVLGPRLLRLLHLTLAPKSLSSIVHPVLQTLATRFGETAFVAKLYRNTVESAAMVLPDDRARSNVQPGRVLPVHAAASAKAIFAFQESAFLDDALAVPRKRYTEATRVDEAAVRAHLAEVRRQGFAVCREEMDPGVLSFACPIYIEGVGVVYSVGLVGLSARLECVRSEEIVEALRLAADQISAVLRSRFRQQAEISRGKADL